MDQFKDSNPRIKMEENSRNFSDKKIDLIKIRESLAESHEYSLNVYWCKWWVEINSAYIFLSFKFSDIESVVIL